MDVDMNIDTMVDGLPRAVSKDADAERPEACAADPMVAEAAAVVAKELGPLTIGPSKFEGL